MKRLSLSFWTLTKTIRQKENIVKKTKYSTKDQRKCYKKSLSVLQITVLSNISFLTILSILKVSLWNCFPYSLILFLFGNLFVLVSFSFSISISYSLVLLFSTFFFSFLTLIQAIDLSYFIASSGNYVPKNTIEILSRFSIEWANKYIADQQSPVNFSPSTFTK